MTACIVGGLAAMAPDADALIRSSTDPLLFLQFHRHFTHALAFVPLGAALTTAALYPFVKRYLSLWRTLLFCVLGYASHGLLDTCTTYGTMLLWPFSERRIAWNNVAVIDPLFTIPVIALVVVALRRRRKIFAFAAASWAIAYLSFGAVQMQRTLHTAAALAQGRGHSPLSLEAMPAAGSLLLWRTVYENDGVFYIDAVRSAFKTEVFPGGRVERLDPERDLPWLDPSSQQAQDIERFTKIARGFVGIEVDRPMHLMDIRYSMLPNGTEGLWAIDVDPHAKPEEHVKFVTNRTIKEGTAKRFFEMLF